MSSEDRRIACYYLTLERTIVTDKGEANVSILSRETLKRFCAYIKHLPDEPKLINIATSNKIVLLDYLSLYEKQGLVILKGLVLAGKYNHSPDYMSKQNGKTRDSDKKMDEAFAEKTHFLGSVSANGVDLLYENRQAGAGIGMTIKCLNKLFKSYVENEKKLKHNVYAGKFYYTPIPVDNLEDAIKDLKNISLGNIYYDKTYFSSEGEALGNVENLSAIQDDVILTIKSKRKKTISHKSAIDFIRGVASDDTKITRVRVEGKNEKGKIIVDTFLTKKFDNINVKLDSKGLVDDYSIFSKMEEILGVDE